MKRTSQYNTLKYLVQCKPSFQAFFETIAAFNHDKVAINYALRCNEVNINSEYRIVTRNSKGQFVSGSGVIVC